VIDNVLVSSEIIRQHASVLDAATLIQNLCVHDRTVGDDVDLIQLRVIPTLRIIPLLIIPRLGLLLVCVRSRQIVLR
jgi:hypothetical protein